MLNSVKNYWADVSSVSPSSEQKNPGKSADCSTLFLSLVSFWESYARHLFFPGLLSITHLVSCWRGLQPSKVSTSRYSHMVSPIHRFFRPYSEKHFFLSLFFLYSRYFLPSTRGGLRIVGSNSAVGWQTLPWRGGLMKVVDCPMFLSLSPPPPPP